MASCICAVCKISPTAEGISLTLGTPVPAFRSLRRKRLIVAECPGRLFCTIPCCGHCCLVTFMPALMPSTCLQGLTQEVPCSQESSCDPLVPQLLASAAVHAPPPGGLGAPLLSVCLCCGTWLCHPLAISSRPATSKNSL
jgi:hypothetical protein